MPGGQREGSRCVAAVPAAVGTGWGDAAEGKEGCGCRTWGEGWEGTGRIAGRWRCPERRGSEPATAAGMRPPRPPVRPHPARLVPRFGFQRGR